MALADYFGRAALAASQVVVGFDSEEFRSRVEDASVAVTVGPDACDSPEGRHISDLTVRLLARLYPALQVSAADSELEAALGELATRINPRIEVTEAADVELIVGSPVRESGATFVSYVGSDGYTALVSPNGPQPIGSTANPFGAGAAACFAVGLVFRRLFLSEAPSSEIVFSTLRETPHAPDVSQETEALSRPVTLVGAGAIGNGALWAFERSQLRGVLHVVDREPIELSNLQRYVLTTADDVNREKVEIPQPAPFLDIQRHALTFEEYAAQAGPIEHVLVALDSAEARRRVQAALPRVVDNAWTQPGDLGVSTHGRFGSGAACLYCLYLPEGETPNEDQLVASALGLDAQLMEVRRLLATGEPLTQPFLDLVAASLGAPVESLLPYEGAPLRSLYVEGLCGGAILPVERLGAPRQEMHIPIAHQSALAGVLLAATVIRRAHLGDPNGTEITRLNVLRDLGGHLTQLAQRTESRVCICHDADYVEAYADKWADDLPANAPAGT